MKKLLILSLFLSMPVFAFEDDIILPLDTTLNIKPVSENIEQNLINTDGMKKQEQVQQAEEKANKQFSKKRVELDTKQLNHQRALDYTTRHTNSMLPMF